MLIAVTNGALQLPWMSERDNSCVHHEMKNVSLFRSRHIFLSCIIGRKVNDRMAADNNVASRYFTSVCFSADGSCVIAGGNSKYVCIYEVSHQILLRKFQLSHNRSLDGVLDEVSLGCSCIAISLKKT